MYFFIVIGIVFLMFLLDLVVTILNYQYRNKPLPEKVKDIYDEDSYTKWLSYNMEQTKLGLFQKTVSFGVVIIFLVLDLFVIFHETSVSIFPQSITLQTGLFVIIYFTVHTIIGIPFEYYSTFVIEEKYGFNKTTKKTFVKDQFKNYLLMFTLLFGLISAISALYQTFVDDIIYMMLGAWLTLVLLTLTIAYLNTKVFVKIFNKLTPLPDGELKDRIIDMANNVGFQIKAISIMDASKRSTKLNAFFSGMGKTREVVLFDTLKEKLTDDEILSVLAHEFGHMVHKDIPKMMIQRSVIYLVFAAVLALILSTNQLFIDFNMPIGHLGFGVILFTILYEPIGLLISMLTNYLSRKAEYKADAYSCHLIDKKHMLSALRKLVKENFSNLNPHPLYEKIHYSHPKIADRLSAIEKLT